MRKTGFLSSLKGLFFHFFRFFFFFRNFIFLEKHKEIERKNFNFQHFSKFVIFAHFKEKFLGSFGLTENTYHTSNLYRDHVPPVIEVSTVWTICISCVIHNINIATQISQKKKKCKNLDISYTVTVTVSGDQLTHEPQNI